MAWRETRVSHPTDVVGEVDWPAWEALARHHEPRSPSVRTAFLAQPAYHKEFANNIPTGEQSPSALEQRASRRPDDRHPTAPLAMRQGRASGDGAGDAHLP